MELVIGHVVVFVLAAICQVAWLARGHRNTPLSGILTLAVSIVGVAVLGWWALATAILGAIFGPVLARMIAGGGPIETSATAGPLLPQPQDPSHVIAGDEEVAGSKFWFSDKPKSMTEIFDEGRPTSERTTQLREWAARGAPGADYELACALLLVDNTVEGISEAVALLEQSAMRWHGRSAHFLSCIYVEGKLIPRDTEKANYWKERLPNKNSYAPESRAYIDNFLAGGEMWKALMIVRDQYLSNDKKRAEAAAAAAKAAEVFERTKERAETGDQAAKFEVAKSQGLDKAGFSLLQESAAEGHAAAQYHLSIHLLKRAATTEDFHAAINLLEKAVEQFDPAATRLLVEVYEQGVFGVQQDAAKAKEWTSRGHPKWDFFERRNELPLEEYQRQFKAREEWVSAYKRAMGVNGIRVARSINQATGGIPQGTIDGPIDSVPTTSA